MVEPKQGTGEPLDQDKADGVPKWVKVTVAIIGGIATIVGIFTGIFALLHEFEHEKTEQAIEKAKQAEAEKDLEKIRQSEGNAGFAFQQQQQQQQLNIEKEKTQQLATALKTQKLEAARQERQVRMEAAKNDYEQLLQERQALSEAIGKLLTSGGDSLAALLVVSRYARSDPDNRDMVLRALALHTERSCNVGELGIAFDVFHESGNRALTQVLDLNRFAARRVRDLLTLHLLALIQGKAKPGFMLQEAKRETIDCQAAHLMFEARHNILSVAAQAALLRGSWSSDGKFHADLESLEELPSDEPIEPLLVCNAEILASSSELLATALRERRVKPSEIDFTDAYLDLRRFNPNPIAAGEVASGGGRNFIITREFERSYSHDGPYFRSCRP